MTMEQSMFEGLGPAHDTDRCPICQAKTKAAGTSTCPPTCINRLSLTCTEHRPTCSTCGPTTAEQHPRLPDVTRCSNCKEHLAQQAGGS